LVLVLMVLVLVLVLAPSFMPSSATIISAGALYAVICCSSLCLEAWRCATLSQG
jgi:hypothetical protein